MIYTHVLARPDIRVVSPLDRLSPVARIEQESKEILPILPEATSALHEGSRDELEGEYSKDGFGAGHETRSRTLRLQNCTNHPADR